MALIEEDGLPAFSFRKLAARLGCEPMSLYHHHPSKAHLLDALLDRVIGELPAPPPPGPWRARLGDMARDFRAMAWRHPSFFQYLALHRLNTPTALRWLDGALTAFKDTGLNDEDAARKHFEATRWPDGPVCPHCGVVNEATLMQGASTRPGLYKCRALTHRH